VAGEVDELLSTHHRLTGPRHDTARLPDDMHVIEESHTDRQSTLLVRCAGPVLDPTWTVENLSLEDVVLAYMGQAGSGTRKRARGGPGATVTTLDVAR
jgi:ABC-2 type transport system ATP-binding protein